MAKKETHTGSPKFPWTKAPPVLRKVLTAIPQKPKPDRLASSTVVSWGAASSPDGTASGAVGVLKKIGLIDQGGSPTALYTQFMAPGVGPAALGVRLREVYQPLFNASHDPARESDANLRNLFNVHSGGSDEVMRLQIHTFKALADHATFDGGGSPVGGKTGAAGPSGAITVAGPESSTLPPIRVDLHIHLPENKSTRDYEAIIQDIAKYIYGRDIERN